MAKNISRKDNRGRKLKDGESYRNDGRYCYRYKDASGKRKYIYDRDLANLREKEKKVTQDLHDGILTDAAIKKMTLNDLFQRYVSTKQWEQSALKNNLSLWKNHVEKSLGQYKIVQLKKSDVMLFYAKTAKGGYAKSTLKTLHTMLCPCLDLAVGDNIIRQNPAKGIIISEYGTVKDEKSALTQEQQTKLLSFVKNDRIYQMYLPMLIIMIGTSCRCGELIGLTWKDVDLKKREVHINHQLVYKNYGDGCKFHVEDPKTEAGFRTIPMSDDVYHAFIKQKELNLLRGVPRDVKVENLSNFIFMSKNGRPLMPSALNNVLYNIVNAYNSKLIQMAGHNKNSIEFMPKFSSHVLRHTGCTRWIEQELQIKIVAYLMGHTSCDITLNVYNHITEMRRVEDEIAKMSSVKVVSVS